MHPVRIALNRTEPTDRLCSLFGYFFWITVLMLINTHIEYVFLRNSIVNSQHIQLTQKKHTTFDCRNGPFHTIHISFDRFARMKRVHVLSALREVTKKKQKTK